MNDLLEPYRIAFEAAPIGLTFLSADWQVLECNPAMCRILGRSEEELRARSATDFTHPDDRHLHERDQQRLLSGEIDSYEFEARYVHADGHVGWVSAHTGVLRRADGAPQTVISVVEDITEKRWMREVHDRLLGLVLVGQGGQALARALAELIECPVALLDGYGAVLAASEHAGRQVAIPTREQLESAAPEDLTIRPLELDDHIEGYLVAENPPAAEHLTARAIEQAASTFALQLAMTRNAENIEHRLHGDLFDAILSARPPELASLQRWAGRLGHDLRSFTRVALARPTTPFDAKDVARLVRAAGLLATELAPGSLVVPRGDGALIALTDAAAGDLARFGRTLADRLRGQTGTEIAVGVSGRLQGPSELSTAIRDAREAVDVALSVPALGLVAVSTELDLRHLLLRGGLAPAEVKDAARRALAPLYDSPRIRDPSKLVQTLATYLDQIGNLEATARELGIHINTLRQRIGRIESALGVELQDARTRVNLQLALDARGR